jgi:hypothetical protein
VHNLMDFSIRIRMDAQIYTYIGHNFEELVSRIGNAHRDSKMGRVGLEVQGHVHI